jgi:colicin import membrane protein
MSGSRRAIVYAVLVHVALIAVIVVGVRWQARPPVPARPIQATATADPETRKELERRKQADKARAEQEAKTKREQQERERQAAEDKRRAEQARVAEQKRAAEEKQKKAEAEKKRKVEEKRRAEERQKLAEQGMKEQLAREEQERSAARAKAEQAARAQSEIARYEGLIRQKVERNWVRPAGWSREMECIVRVRLVPTGEVISATIARSSGDPAFDRSVENAVYKAAPLPLPEDKGLFEHFRELELRFRPEGQA